MSTKVMLRLSLLAAFVLGAVMAPGESGYAQGESRLFPETGKTVKGKFLDYWNTHGGLPQQGFPISEEMQEVSDTNGRTYSVQYFERAVFEMHPENAGTRFEVLLSQLGTFRFRAKYAQGTATPQPTRVTPSPTRIPPTPTRPAPTATSRPVATPVPVESPTP